MLKVDRLREDLHQNVPNFFRHLEVETTRTMPEQPNLERRTTDDIVRFDRNGTSSCYEEFQFGKGIKILHNSKFLQ